MEVSVDVLGIIAASVKCLQVCDSLKDILNVHGRLEEVGVEVLSLHKVESLTNTLDRIVQCLGQNQEGNEPSNATLTSRLGIFERARKELISLLQRVSKHGARERLPNGLHENLEMLQKQMSIFLDRAKQ
jgi:hypothetical protein